MVKKLRVRLIPLTILAIMLLVACGGAATEAEDAGADAEAAPDATDANGGEDAGEPLEFTVAVVDPDIASVPLLAAIEALREDGHAIESVEVAEPELAIEGLARDEFQFSGVDQPCPHRHPEGRPAADHRRRRGQPLGDLRQ